MTLATSQKWRKPDLFLCPLKTKLKAALLIRSGFLVLNFTRRSSDTIRHHAIVTKRAFATFKALPRL